MILANEKPYIVVEAKNINETPDKGLGQIINYCNHLRLRFGLVTNGREWWFVDEQWRDPETDDRVFLKINTTNYQLDTNPLFNFMDNMIDKTELIKLINPNFSEILEDFAEEYRNILNKRSDMTKKELYEVTIQQITKIENVNLSQALKLMLNKDMTNIHCPQSIILNNKNIEITSWKDILLEIIKANIDELLGQKIIITFNHAKYDLVTLKRKSPDNGYSEVNINNRIVYVYTWLDVNDIIRAIDLAKTSIKLPNNYIRFTREWFEQVEAK